MAIEYRVSLPAAGIPLALISQANVGSPYPSTGSNLVATILAPFLVIVTVAEANRADGIANDQRLKTASRGMNPGGGQLTNPSLVTEGFQILASNTHRELA
jgi:hypothetical protein